VGGLTHTEEIYGSIDSPPPYGVSSISGGMHPLSAIIPRRRRPAAVLVFQTGFLYDGDSKMDADSLGGPFERCFLN